MAPLRQTSRRQIFLFFEINQRLTAQNDRNEIFKLSSDENLKAEFSITCSTSNFFLSVG